MDRRNLPPVLTNQQFEKLIHYIGIRIEVALKRPNPSRVESLEELVGDLEADLKQSLVGASDA